MFGNRIVKISPQAKNISVVIKGPVIKDIINAVTYKWMDGLEWKSPGGLKYRAAYAANKRPSMKYSLF